MQIDCVQSFTLPLQNASQQVLFPCRFGRSYRPKRQANGLRCIRLGDHADNHVFPRKSGNGKGIFPGIQELHTAKAQGRVFLFERAQGMLQLIMRASPEVLPPGHGIAAALIGINSAVNFRLVPIVNGGGTREQELEAGRSLKIRLRDLRIVVQSRGIMTVEQVELCLPQGKRQLGQMLHDPRLKVLRRLMAAHSL